MWYNEPVVANGYYLTTGPESPAGDMSEWMIESTPSNWSLSNRVHHSSWYNLQLPTKRNTDFVFDYAIEEPFSRMLLATPFIFAVGFALSVIMGAIGYEAGVPAVLAATFLSSGVVRVVAGLGFLIVTGNFVGYSSIWITTPQVA